MKLFFVSLGCDKNLVDSEKMLALLSKHEIEITEDSTQADIIIVNTCGFIQSAKEESIETILEMAELKNNGKCRSLIVTGCLAQRYAEEIREEIPEVDVVVGTTAYDRIFEAVQNSMEGNHANLMKDLDYLPEHLTERVRTSSPHISYLKIAEGCNKRCTYCIIPSLRGNYRSVPMEDLVCEAEKLAESGTKELIIVAQETTVYGVDLYKEKKLSELLRKLCRIDGIEWIRLLYCYPEEITDELLFSIRDEKKICHYLDLPIQHCNDDILRRMGRKTNKQDLTEKLKRIREIIPDVALRTTLISGFPGETNQQHLECVEFAALQKFDRLGVFPYSAEEGTPAAEYENQIEEEIKQSRADEIMEAEQNVIFEQNEQLIGKKMNVMIDGFLPDDNVYIGRTYRDAPDIDGCVFVSAGYEIVSGTIVTVIITDANGYDLIGEICSEEDE
jgi:ribosomal protein S12 methylthiotransferase